MHIHIHIHIYTYIYVHYVYTSTSVYIYMHYVHTFTYMHTYIHVYIIHIYTYIHTCLHVQSYTCTYVHVHIHTSTNVFQLAETVAIIRPQNYLASVETIRPDMLDTCIVRNPSEPAGMESWFLHGAIWKLDPKADATVEFKPCYLSLLERKV